MLLQRLVLRTTPLADTIIEHSSKMLTTARLVQAPSAMHARTVSTARRAAQQPTVAYLHGPQRCYTPMKRWNNHRAVSCFQQPFMNEAGSYGLGQGRFARSIMKELMNEIGRQWEDPSSSSSTQRAIPFFVDTAEDDTAYYLFADLPGVEKKDLRITTKDQTITITAKRTRPGSTTGPPSDKGVLDVVDEFVNDQEAAQDTTTTASTPPPLRARRQERPFGMFRRQLTFPEDADLQGGVTATVTAGVVQVTIPKRVVEQPEWREIPIV